MLVIFYKQIHFRIPSSVQLQALKKKHITCSNVSVVNRWDVLHTGLMINFTCVNNVSKRLGEEM